MMTEEQERAAFEAWYGTPESADKDSFEAPAWREMMKEPTQTPTRIAELVNALTRLVEAEDRYVKEAGVSLDDPIADAVKHAKSVLTDGKDLT